MGFFSAKGDRISGYIVRPLKMKIVSHILLPNIAKLEISKRSTFQHVRENFKIPRSSFN